MAAEGSSPTPWPQSLSSGMADFVVEQETDQHGLRGEGERATETD